jgi:hypothetical protein
LHNTALLPGFPHNEVSCSQRPKRVPGPPTSRKKMAIAASNRTMREISCVLPYFSDYIAAFLLLRIYFYHPHLPPYSK